MEDPTQINAVRFHDVVFDTDGMMLFGHQTKLLFVAKKDIRTITLKDGFQSERPILEMIFGIFVVGLGFYFFLNFILKALVYRIIYIEELLSLFLFPIGGWFVIDGFRKRLYFEVALDNDKRKFPLGKNPDKGELQKFIKIASQLGYSIDAKVLDMNIIN
jgi:hypothetical protein